MKPDVIEQTAQLEKTRQNIGPNPPAQMMDGNAIIMHQEGKEPTVLTNDQVVQIIQTQQTQIKEMITNLANVQKEKTILENTVMFLTSHQMRDDNDPNSGGGTSNNSALTECISKLNERDETIKKLKGLYMKNIVESAELKSHIGEMRQQLQDLQAELYRFRTRESNANENGNIKLYIE
jgi:hypothetical protein